MCQENSIVANTVPSGAMLATLPKHFGVGRMMRVEDSVYDTMAQLATQYRGGAWSFHELSNGGFYMRPKQGPWTVRMRGNGFEASMSADAAGITVCLLVLSSLAHQDPHAVYVNHYHWLRDYAVEHPDWNLIGRAVD